MIVTLKLFEAYLKCPTKSFPNLGRGQSVATLVRHEAKLIHFDIESLCAAVFGRPLVSVFCQDIVSRMAVIYRKHSGSQQWHTNPECPDWPFAEYSQRTDLPSGEVLCAECVKLLDEPDEDDESDN